MGGTERDSRWAATIKGTLTQADAQVVQAFSFHVAYTSGNNAGKCTFSVCPHCSPHNELHRPFNQIARARNLAKHTSAFVTRWYQFHPPQMYGELSLKKIKKKNQNTTTPSKNGTRPLLLLSYGREQRQLCGWAGEQLQHALRQSSSLHKGQQISAFISTLPLLFGTVEGWMESRAVGVAGGFGGSLASIGKPVFGSLCCRISWLCVALPSRAARLSWWNQVVRPIPLARFVTSLSASTRRFSRCSSRSFSELRSSSESLCCQRWNSNSFSWKCGKHSVVNKCIC